VLLSLKRVILLDRSAGFSRRALGLFFVCVFVLLWCVTPGLAQKASQDATILPKYDLHTEMKTKGTVDEVNLLPVGSRKDLTELIIKSGEDKIHIYVCPKTFEDEMGISFSKGDEVSVMGSKVKQEALDVILARELVKGTDTLVFRDGKGNPVWDPRTGK
jgi:hypothetical protein